MYKTEIDKRCVKYSILIWPIQRQRSILANLVQLSQRAILRVMVMLLLLLMIGMMEHHKLRLLWQVCLMALRMRQKMRSFR